MDERVAFDALSVSKSLSRQRLPRAEQRRRRDGSRWAGDQRQRHPRRLLPIGVERLISKRLVERDSEIAAAVEAILNRYESKRTVATVTTELVDFLSFCRSRHTEPFGARARDLVSAWIADTRERWAPLTRRRAITSVRTLYDELAERSLYLGPNPTKRMPRISAEPRNDPAALTPEEVRALLAEMDRRVEAAAAVADRGQRLRALRDRLAVNILLYCGLRIAELCALRWQDRINYGRHHVLAILGKGNKPAKVKVNAVLEKLLDAYRAEFTKLGELSGTGVLSSNGLKIRSSDPIFFGLVIAGGIWPPSVRRAAGAIQPWGARTAAKMVDEALAVIGRDEARTGPHLLRRTSGTLVYEATHDLYLTQMHLRHASPATTSRHYIRQADPFADSGIDHLDFSETRRSIAR